MSERKPFTHHLFLATPRSKTQKPRICSTETFVLLLGFHSWYNGIMSNRERIYRTRAVILSRRDYNDADRILTVFTPDLGKRELIAKGVRKTISRKAGHLEPLSHASLLVAQARTWDIITEAVTVESFRYVRENLDAIGYASYVS